MDSGVEAGLEVSGFYDPLLAKLVVHGVDREHARARMLRALGEYEIGGVETLIGFHRALLSEPCFVEAGTCHGIVESEELAEKAKQLSHTTTTVSPHSDGKLRSHVLPVELDGRRFDVRVLRREPPHAALARSRRDRARAWARAAAADAVVSPMQGTVLHVRVTDGQEVAAGDVLCIVEAMKMENEIAAHRSGVVTGLAVSPGQAVTLGQVICVLGQEGEPGPRRRFCSDVSRDHGEALGATASRVDRWILIEYHGAWGRDAVDSSQLPSEVKGHLAERASALGPAKVLFVRRRERRSAEGIHVFWGRSAERASWLSTTVVEGYEDVLELDFDSPGEASPSAVARVHARKARRVLCSARASGLRSDARARRRRLGVAVLTRGR